MIENNSQTVAGLNSAETTLNQALIKVIAEFSPLSCEAATNLTWFNFLLDQVIEAAPGIHPMTVAEELYLRVVPSTDRKAISAAFKMGALIASSVRGKSKEHNDAMKAEIQKAIQARNQFEQATFNHLVPRRD